MLVFCFSFEATPRDNSYYTYVRIILFFQFGLHTALQIF